MNQVWGRFAELLAQIERVRLSWRVVRRTVGEVESAAGLIRTIATSQSYWNCVPLVCFACGVELACDLAEEVLAFGEAMLKAFADMQPRTCLNVE